MAEHPALELEFLHAPPSDSSLSDRLYALLDDFGPIGLDDAASPDRWRVFFHARPERDAAAEAIATAFGGSLRTSAIEVDDEDWARRSQQDLRAVTAGQLVIAPPWDVPKGMPVIIIEPSMGFGTGHHATTRLCLTLMQRLDLRGARVLDVGTGSGVLALAAWKLGAAEITAVDADADALENARLNVARNGAAPSIDIVRDDLATLRIERADVVLANLTGAALVRFASELASLAVSGGYIILSGFAPEDVPIIHRAFSALARIDEQSEGEWAALCLRR
ncbi:MAG: 50S ribosomal protein L11 methyltransferase [Vicinamibacterales bacterium]